MSGREVTFGEHLPHPRHQSKLFLHNYPIKAPVDSTLSIMKRNRLKEERALPPGVSDIVKIPEQSSTSWSSWLKTFFPTVL